MRDKLMNCEVDYDDSFWGKQKKKAPAFVINQSAHGARSPTKRNVHLVQECVGQARFGENIVGRCDGKSRIVSHENSTG